MTTAAEAAQTIDAAQAPTGAALEPYREILLLSVNDQASLGKMTELVKTMKAGIKQVEEWFEPMKTAAHAAHKKICDKEKETLAPFRDAEKSGQAAINTFLTAERERARKEQLEKEKEEAVKRQKEQENLKEAADELERLGDATGAVSLRQEAELAIAAPAFVEKVESTVRVGGGSAAGGATLSGTVKVTAQVTDVKLFLKYLVEQNSAATFIEFPKAKLDAWVKANGIKAGQVPGLAIKEEVKSSIR